MAENNITQVFVNNDRPSGIGRGPLGSQIIVAIIGAIVGAVATALLSTFVSIPSYVDPIHERPYKTPYELPPEPIPTPDPTPVLPPEQPYFNADADGSLSVAPSIVSNFSLPRQYHEVEQRSFEAEFSYIVGNADNPDFDSIYQMEKLGEQEAKRNQWREATKAYFWLFQQSTTGERRAGIIKNFNFTSDMYASSEGILGDININPAKAIINHEGVRFRLQPVLNNANIKRHLMLSEELVVVGRGDSPVTIGNNTAYWYRISTIDGAEEGWVYGLYLNFLPKE